MEVPFRFNDRDYVAVATQKHGIEVRYGCVTLPSEASAEIFIRARHELGLPESQVIQLQ